MSNKSSDENGFFKNLAFIESAIVSVALVVMIAVIFLQIIFRYFSTLDLPGVEGIRDVAMFMLPWTEEVARYAMIWAVFIGASMGAKTGAHVGVDALVRFLPPRFLKYALILSGTCSVVFCLAITVIGVIMLDIIWDTGQRSPALEIPVFWAYLAVPTGAALGSFRFYQATVVKVNLLKIAEGKQA